MASTGQAEPIPLDKGRPPPAPPPPPGTAAIRRHAGTVGLFTMASRLLGLVREWLMAHFVGAGLAGSAFYVAFAIPNFARRLFGEGALTSAFVPVFKGLAENDRMDAARRLARAVATMAWIMLGAAVLLAMLAVSGALAFFPAMPERAAATLGLLRVMLPYAVFICAAAFGMGVLNALGRFAAAAFAPCLLNLVWIGTLLAILFFPDLPLFERVRILSWAILAAGVLQMGFLLWCAARRGVPLVPSREGWGDPSTKLVWRNTATAIVGAGAVQINAFLDQVLALYAAEWAPSAIAYALEVMHRQVLDLLGLPGEEDLDRHGSANVFSKPLTPLNKAQISSQKSTGAKLTPGRLHSLSKAADMRDAVGLDLSSIKCCPECGSSMLQHVGGCVSCPDCGWTRCD